MRNYSQVVAAVFDKPWAITPQMLATISRLVQERASGNEATPEQVQAALAGSGPPRKDAQRAGAVAVLPLYGVLVPKADLMSEMSGGTSLQRFSQALAQVVRDPDVGAIVLDIDSPGGSTDMVPELAAEIRQAAQDKPVYAVANSLAGSAAYWLGAQASAGFYASPSASVGSIGVYAAHSDVSGAMEKAGVKTTLISAGKHKTELSPFEPLSDEALAAVQERVDHFYGMFVSDVARGRGVTEASVRGGFGEGRVLPARAGMSAGMVDGIETLEGVVGRAQLALASGGGSTGAQLGAAFKSGTASAHLPAHTHALLPHVNVTENPVFVSATAEPISYTFYPLNPSAEELVEGLTFADEAERARTHADALVTRAGALAALRREQGRPLSQPARSRLLVASAAFSEAAAALDGLLAEVAPTNQAEADLLRELARYELSRLHSYEGNE